MSDAQWTAIFVTANLPIELVNSVLETATQEKYQVEGCLDELVGNSWVLIQDPDQQTVSKPTNPPVASFESGFLGASVSRLQEFVKARLGDNGLGRGSNRILDHLADDAFGVIDERTAKDNTILFCAQELVDPIQEAEIRVAWKTGTKRDEALVRYADGDEYDGDLAFLVGSTDGQDTDEARARLESWIDTEREKETMKWFEFRLNVGTAVQDTHGINQRGVFDMLLDRDGDYDENGVMIG